jgi:hypothetical protein
MFLSTTMQVPIVPLSINGKIGDIWSNALSGVRPRVRINIGKPFGPYSLPKDRSQKEEKLAKIGDEVMCRIAALLPDKHHGVYRGNPSIKNYREENNL